ncbi:MAG: 4-alpha-glucanotransferase, partial [Saprospiraceae bacterium]
MSLHFHIHYRTVIGDQVAIEYYTVRPDEKTLIFGHTYDGENWTFTVNNFTNQSIHYQYILLKNEKIVGREWGHHRSIESTSEENKHIKDHWRPRANENNAFLSSAFTDVIFHRDIVDKDSNGLQKKLSDQNEITFRLLSPMIPSHLKYGVIGNTSWLGDWKIPVVMNDTEYPLWQITLPLDAQDSYIEYKYVVYDPKDQSIQYWEVGENRKSHCTMPSPTKNQIYINDDYFLAPDIKWKGSGVAIPVFSLRSKTGCGIGEFKDLRLLTDWAHDVGMKIIQVLPINDTIAQKSWTDSYPYAAISVYALQPLYINLESIATFKSKKHQIDWSKQVAALNKLDEVDFERVLELKFTYLKVLFDQEYDHFRADPKAMQYIKDNAGWIDSYAAFCHLRDRYKTCNFHLWQEYSVYREDLPTELYNESEESKRAMDFYIFIQYHADKQLVDAKMYARSKGVVLKGDLPIGIYRYSCDAWVAPSLYNMDEQAGAPPDDYAVLGQNWGFPTYNWSEMAKDGYLWWRQRMQQLNRYFDAMRVDHILGFFRIWFIPTSQVEGTMGMFNPRLPMSKEALDQYGITGDLSRYTTPYITEQILQATFGHEVEDIFDIFFYRNKENQISFRASFDDQKKISTFVSQNTKYKKFEQRLFNLISEVLLLVEPESEGQFFNPRITLSTTQSFQHLDDSMQERLLNLYNDYYFTRHDEYWKSQALQKLPTILDASDMLICGEDLGMIPKSVPGVMKKMNIISLEIQRMPKQNARFAQTRSYPYFSVCSPSCHDMSTIRGWWQADHENAKEYYDHYLHWYGLTPIEASPEIVQAIIEDHLASPSMWAIFPIQDLFGMDASLRKKDPFSEQINEPSNPKHYWKFRFHIDLEDMVVTKP